MGCIQSSAPSVPSAPSVHSVPSVPSAPSLPPIPVPQILIDATCENTPVFYPSFQVAKCIKVYDGDTVHLACVVDDEKVHRFTARMFGYDSPELRSKNGREKKAAKEARDFLAARVLGKIVIVRVHHIPEKWGRVLVTLFDDSGEINEWMISKGHGVRYNGGTKQEFANV